ncbi:hypothetical protein SAMN05443144_1323 [Fodinibius roseus]|uniref:Uncharacterized protein n=1 Tax=Fodinibius roseus TaxID=1194090 RepID=A0A1M5KFW1_9BACT|nr:hypothetical protein [Fodinibius roseus]SHG51736.1 hypothetical protein SAMN05443144_1323 [Fodinibius roseus]
MEYTKKDVANIKENLLESLLVSEHQVEGLIAIIPSISGQETNTIDLSSLNKAKAAIQEAIQQLEKVASAKEE